METLAPLIAAVSLKMVLFAITCPSLVPEDHLVLLCFASEEAVNKLISSVTISTVAQLIVASKSELKLDASINLELVYLLILATPKPV